jgi:hypothetical protein
MNIQGHNLPIQLQLTGYKSLEAYRDSLGVNSKLHLSLIFTKMADEIIHKAANDIIKSIQADQTIHQLADGISLQFKQFKLTGNNCLVAEYEAINKNDGKDAAQQYRDFINQCRRMVRRSADQLEGKEAQRQQVTQGANSEEHCYIHGKKAYIMDTRTPLIHITLKYGAAQGDLNTIMQIFQQKALPPPASLQIRLNNLLAIPTKSTNL